MPPAPWRLVLYAAALMAALVYMERAYRSESSGAQPATGKFNVSEELKGLAASRHLSHEGCLAIYPGLFVEVDRAAAFWRQKGGITLDHIDKAMVAGSGNIVRAVILDGELYVKWKDRGRHSRVHSTLAMIHDAMLTSREPIPDIEFVIYCDDHLDNSDPNVPVLVLDRTDRERHLWLIPDFGFNSWPEPKVGTFSEVKRKAGEFDARHPWKTKTPKLFWKGALLVDIRRKFFDLAKDWGWAQIEEVDWGNKETVMTMDAHCGFKYLAHLEGIAYSGRLKYLMMCHPDSSDRNLVVIPGRKWEKLPETMQHLMNNDTAAEELADRSYVEPRSPSNTMSSLLAD
ncbi:hypothetical protein Dda_3897 [Drechslerella dactyloides]|uniref:Glycosyl transferase CAP10 domain-containing protein n=1 Tax=Drechslerella dactyloides TaxID=74499 RepID=A0AAD6J0A0_DREDA|nr:hypothetical protein Dda_3897 [Drechslerella dactyloides]